MKKAKKQPRRGGLKFRALYKFGKVVSDKRAPASGARSARELRGWRSRSYTIDEAAAKKFFLGTPGPGGPTLPPPKPLSKRALRRAVRVMRRFELVDVPGVDVALPADQLAKLGHTYLGLAFVDRPEIPAEPSRKEVQRLQEYFRPELYPDRGGVCPVVQSKVNAALCDAAKKVRRILGRALHEHPERGADAALGFHRLKEAAFWFTSAGATPHRAMP